MCDIYGYQMNLKFIQSIYRYRYLNKIRFDLIYSI